MESTKEYLKELVETIQQYTGLSKGEIAERLGYSRTYLSDALASGGSKKLISAIHREFGISDKPITDIKIREIPNVIETIEFKGRKQEHQHQHALPYTKVRYEKKLSVDKDVPVYVGNTQLGPVQVYSDDPTMQKPVASLPAQLFPGCNHAEKVSGDSMYPLIMNQAYVVGKIIDKNGIIFGEKYGVHTRYGMNVVKFIHPGSKETHLKLVSYNKSIPDQEIPMDDISFIFRVNYILNPA